MNYYIRKPKENSVTRKKKEKKTIDHILKLSLVLFGIRSVHGKKLHTNLCEKSFLSSTLAIVE